MAHNAIPHNHTPCHKVLCLFQATKATLWKIAAENYSQSPSAKTTDDRGEQNHPDSLENNAEALYLVSCVLYIYIAGMNKGKCLSKSM